MAAPDLKTLWQFERNIVASVVKALQAETHVQLYARHVVDMRQTPLAAVRYQHSSNTGNLKVFPVMGHADYNEVAYPRMFQGDLEFEIVSQREDATDHDTAISEIRSLMFDWTLNFTLGDFGYYQIENVQDSGSQARVESEDNLDVTTLTYRLVWSIREDAWPVIT